MARFNKICTQLPDLKGESLLEALESQLNLTQYFRKIAIDSVLYARYEMEFSDLINPMDADMIGSLFIQVEEDGRIRQIEGT